MSDEVVREEHVESTVTETAPPDAGGDPGLPVETTVAASQGAVAVAAEAVALANTTAAQAEQIAAETIVQAERSMEQRLEEVETWRAGHETAMATLATEIGELKAANTSILETLTQAMQARRSPSTATVPASEVSPDDNVVVENPAPRRRHRLI